MFQAILLLKKIFLQRCPSLPSLLTENFSIVGILHSTTITSLHGYYYPCRHRLAFHRFPVLSVIRCTFPSPISQRSTRTTSPVASCAFVTVLFLPLRLGRKRYQSRFLFLCRFHPITIGSASRSYVFSKLPVDSFALRPGNSPPILMMVCQWASTVRFPAPLPLVLQVLDFSPDGPIPH